MQFLVQGLHAIKLGGNSGLFNSLLTFNWLAQGKAPERSYQVAKVALSNFRVTSLYKEPESNITLLDI